MKTWIVVILALAVSLSAQVINIPTPTIIQAEQYNGGILCAVEPMEEAELYYFWRDGEMVAWGTEPYFLDYPQPGLHVYEVQVSIGWTRGELSAPAVVDTTEPVFVYEFE